MRWNQGNPTEGSGKTRGALIIDPATPVKRSPEGARADADVGAAPSGAPARTGFRGHGRPSARLKARGSGFSLCRSRHFARQPAARCAAPRHPRHTARSCAGTPWPVPIVPSVPIDLPRLAMPSVPITIIPLVTYISTAVGVTNRFLRIQRFLRQRKISGLQTCM
jgi:hypothetical protein